MALSDYFCCSKVAAYLYFSVNNVHLLLFIIYSVVLIVAYAALMTHYRRAWQALPFWNLPSNFQAQTKVSVLIPARNEAANIEACLQSVLAQNYPSSLFEVIVLDDHSTDQTPEIVQSFAANNVHLITLAEHLTTDETQSFKKKALDIGVQKASGQLIVTTDADCVVQKNWLQLLVSFYEQKGYRFIAAPVNFHQEKNALERFQSLDFLGMMGISGAGVQSSWMRMCNGANLAYEKSLFQEVNGFEGINDLASGDDMLLMQKVAQRDPSAVGYLKNPSVTTFTIAKPTLSSFIQQRLRWATKSSSYPERWMTVALAAVFLFCTNIFLSMLLAIFWQQTLLLVTLFSIVSKAIMDYLLLKDMAIFFHRRDLLYSFWTSFVLHTVYIVGIGLAANLKKDYQWKGRIVR